jgi:hypothetical protein
VGVLPGGDLKTFVALIHWGDWDDEREGGILKDSGKELRWLHK